MDEKDKKLDGEQNENVQGGNENNTDDKGGEEKKPKTFTQEEVSAMMAKEKGQGKRAIIS